ncbi:MAG: sigma-54 dependent transcriptional regulator [Candidatus Poribacteria bacterium]|nr:sigma-54 dependent transcriptional regulator [Candidatus Poribacteria bacterium]
MSTATILIIEDELSYWSHYKRKLAPLGFLFEMARHPKEADTVMKGFQPNLILLDLSFDGSSPDTGLNFLSKIRKDFPDIKVIVITASTDRQVALEAIQRGASDFLEKGSGFLDALRFRVQAVFERLQLEQQIEVNNEGEINRVGGYPYGPGKVMVGTSREMRTTYEFIDKVAKVDETILIMGESGTGKELVAQAVHYHSQRSDKVFLPLNCAAFPVELIEDELFGHQHGAFSGATSDRAGAFEAADGGIIFLDEIGEMPISMQPRLLRVLQEKRIKRIGENVERTVDVRVIAATNRDLTEEVRLGNFREDLYYRLNSLPIHLPPLRHRKEDLLLLIRYFSDLFCQQYSVQRRFTSESVVHMQKHDWPGNIRQLRDLIQRSILMSDREEISVQDLDFSSHPEAETVVTDLSSVSPSDESDVQSYVDVRRAFEAWYVNEVLRITDGNQTRAAQLLDIDRNSIRRILKRAVDLEIDL